MGPRRPAKKALPEKRIYFTLAVEAITTLKDPTGTSQPAIEKYIASTYGGFNFKRHLLRGALKRAIAKGDILVHHNHKNSYKMPPKSAAKKKAPTKKKAKKKAPAKKKKVTKKKKTTKKKKVTKKKTTKKKRTKKKAPAKKRTTKKKRSKKKK